MGFLALEFISSLVNKFQIWISKKYNLYLNDDKWYIRYSLEFVFSIANRSLQLADKIRNPKLRIGIKFAIMVDFICLTIYLTICSVIYIIIFVFLFAIINSFIGGSSSGSGGEGGRSSSSSGAIFGSSYEETAKEESRPFKIDKETKSSEGALPFGLGGDTIYKTEYEDTSTGETVKGHGWTRSEADFNARKNLGNK